MDMTESELQAFHEHLHENNFQGQWEKHESDSKEPRLEPHRWEWDDIVASLNRSKDYISLDDMGPGSRRALVLDNPAEGIDLRGPCWTMLTAVQMVIPGEVARAHRHNFEAFRFIVQGNDSVVTNVNGEKLPARTGDLLLTPRMAWHDHINNSSEDVIWIDGLNTPFITDALHDMHFEEFQSDRQSASHESGYFESQFGTMQPVAETPTDDTPPYRFPWESARQSLEMAVTEDNHYDPHNGYFLEYVNPRTGQGPVLQTISLRLQLLQSGEETQSHRHNNTEIFHVVSGSGESTIGGKTYTWEEGDFFVVPPMRWHDHSVTSSDDVILFNITDSPIFDAFNLRRTESKDA
ncbi:cupin domain-containing protein [Natrinema soli]|uniref:Cupin domain-containing protein n=1 Tax=Natrinema soli TaxID=1930624 RepID=A0ABD5SIU9_9EURY|nr:cupin domain-containing protein [Natrinema soli]